MTVALLAHAEAARREEVTQLGLWMFLATVTMLFAAFTSAYIVRKSGSDWMRIALPTALWLNTALLVASSAALEFGWHAGSRGRWRLAHATFAVAIALGFAFLAGQFVAWRQLQEAGVFLPASPHSSFFYMMTGAHALHIVAALGVLIWGAARTWRGDGQLDRRAWAAGIGLCRTFWHYLLGVWVYLFVFISVY